MPSPSLVDSDAVSEPEERGDELLGQSPPWGLGVCIIAIGTLLGLWLVGIILLSSGEETVAVRAKVGGDIAPVAVYAEHGGTVEMLYVADEARVAAGELLARMRVDEQKNVHEDIRSPFDGTVLFVRPLEPSTRIEPSSVVVAVVRTTGSTRAVGYVDEPKVARLREGLRVRLHTSWSDGPPVIDAHIASIGPASGTDSRRITMLVEQATPVLTERVQAHGELDMSAVIVIRRRGFVERAIEATGAVIQWVTNTWESELFRNS